MSYEVLAKGYVWMSFCIEYSRREKLEEKHEIEFYISIN